MSGRVSNLAILARTTGLVGHVSCLLLFILLLLLLLLFLLLLLLLLPCPSAPLKRSSKGRLWSTQLTQRRKIVRSKFVRTTEIGPIRNQNLIFWPLARTAGLVGHVSCLLLFILLLLLLLFLLLLFLLLLLCPVKPVPPHMTSPLPVCSSEEKFQGEIVEHSADPMMENCLLQICSDNRNRSNQESKFDFLATCQRLGKIDGGQTTKKKNCPHQPDNQILAVRGPMSSNLSPPTIIFYSTCSPLTRKYSHHGGVLVVALLSPDYPIVCLV